VLSLAFAKDGRTLVTGGHDSTIRLWDIYTTKQRRLIRGHQGTIHWVALSPDGNTLASASDDGTLRQWDLTTWVKDRPLEPLTHRKELLEGHWASLKDENACAAHLAIFALASARRQSLPLLKEHLKPVPLPEVRRVSQLINDLDSSQFKTREKACESLAKMEEAAVPALQRAFSESVSPEARRHLTRLLERLDPITDPERIRTLRCLEILELAGTSEALQILETLTKGAPEARETREAKAASERLARKLAAKPQAAP
jgi:hypothetical protein